MSSNSKLKEAYDVVSKYGAFYTGGNIQWHEDSIFCQTSTSVNILNIEDGTVAKSIGQEPDSNDPDPLQTFTSDGDKVVTSHKSGLLKLWTLEGVLVKMWKYIHKGPVAKLCLKGQLLLSGGSDGSVRLWDLEHHTCLSGLKGCVGVVDVVDLHTDSQTVFASGDDGKIHTWEVQSGKQVLSYNSHYSKVTSLVFSQEHFVSCGRDKVIMLWRINEPKPLKTIPLYESVESIVLMPKKFRLPNFKPDPENIYVASAGEGGIVRVWEMNNAKEVYKQDNSLVAKAEDGAVAITRLLNKDSKSIAVVTADHNIIVHQLKSFVVVKQFIGFSDEILDLVLVGEAESHLAVATNSSDIKLYDNATMSCQLLRGHSDIVLALSVPKSKPNLMVSSGKDNKVLLWTFDGTFMTCVATALRHTASVGALAFSNTTADFCISGSQDHCIKLWQIEGTSLNCTRTEIAHEKDINGVAVSPNDKIIATASQDKTAKLWTENLSLVGSLKGHRRGVWSVQFSPVDQVVATSSADCTIRLWSVVDLNCLKTLEGHDSSVLKVAFLNNGFQLLSAGADGFVKLFNMKTSETDATFGEHDGKIWAMVLNNDQSLMVTGGSDSLLVKWKDVTEERKEQRFEEQAREELEQQKLSNYMQSGKLLKALKLALKLDRPFQTFNILEGIVKKKQMGELEEVVSSLRNDQKDSLLKCATSWNMNSKTYQIAQLVFAILLKEIQSGTFEPSNMQSFIESALPYTERHFTRMTQLAQDLQIIEYTLNCMQTHGSDQS